VDDDSLILARGLVVRYGRRFGINGVDLDVPARSLFGFLGPNGAGKTTTIRALLGFLRAQAGEARIFGSDCWRKSHAIKREVGYLPGDLRLYSWMTATSALRLAGRIRGDDGPNRGADLIERLKLDSEVPVRRMSRGMRQKLGLILALAHRPRLLILDEPTAGLDPIMQQELERILRERVEHDGATVFFSSHTLNEVERLCDHVAMIRDGAVVESATIRDLQSRARRRITIEFENEQSAAEIAPPEALDLVERRPKRWIAEFDGPATALTDWLHAQSSIRDFTIGPPDLETVFHRYYRQDDAHDDEERES